jgi:hypothetical protein
MALLSLSKHRAPSREREREHAVYVCRLWPCKLCSSWGSGSVPFAHVLHLHGREEDLLSRTHCTLAHLCLLSVNALVIHVMDRSALRLGRFQPTYVDTTSWWMHAWSVSQWVWYMHASMHATNGCQICFEIDGLAGPCWESRKVAKKLLYHFGLGWGSEHGLSKLD